MVPNTCLYACIFHSCIAGEPFPECEDANYSIGRCTCDVISDPNSCLADCHKHIDPHSYASVSVFLCMSVDRRCVLTCCWRFFSFLFSSRNVLLRSLTLQLLHEKATKELHSFIFKINIWLPLWVVICCVIEEKKRTEILACFCATLSSSNTERLVYIFAQHTAAVT